MAKSLIQALSWAALLGLHVAIAQDQPNTKPAIDPPFDFNNAVESGLLNNLSPTQSHWDQWGAGWIVADCKAFAENHGYSPSDFEVFNVHYTDCDEAWIMCRHKSSSKSQVDMIDIFGRMPLGMREFVKHIAVVPDIGTGVAAYSTGDSILFDDQHLTAYIMAHEMSHSLDGHARQDVAPDGFSRSSIWKDNYNQDSAVVSEYGRTTWAENFAETGIIGLYDKVVPGGIGNIQPNWNAVFHQYATFQGFMGDVIIPHSKSKCTQRVGNSETVPMATATKALGQKVDTNFKTDVVVVPPSPFGTTIHVCPQHV